MNKKLKFAIPFAVLALTCGIAAGCNGCNKHEHSYTEWGYNEIQHWKECPEDDVIDESSKADHNFVDGSCECGATEQTPGPDVPVTYGSVKIKMELCKVGTLVKDFTGIGVDFGDDDVEFGSISSEGICEINHVKVGKQYTVKVTKAGYEGYTAIVQLTEENEVAEVDARLEYSAFVSTSKWPSWCPNFYHTDEGDHTFIPNDNTVSVHSVDRFDDVAATLKVKKSNTTNAEGVWLFFEDGGMCPVKITSSGTVEFDTRDSYDSWGDAGNLAGNLGVEHVTNLFTKSDVTDKDGVKHYTGTTMTDELCAGHENGTLELTLVRKANVVYIFVDGKFADMRVLDEKYANQKVRIGYYAMDCFKNVSQWSYGYTTDLSSYFTELTPTVALTDGIQSSVCTATLDKASYNYGEDMQLTVDLKDTNGYYVEGVRVDGKLYKLTDGKLTLRVDSEYDIRVSVYAKTNVTLNADVKVKKTGVETALADGTDVTISGGSLSQATTVKVSGGKISTQLLPGEYTFAADGYISATAYVKVDGSVEGGIVLGYKSAEAIVYGDKIDLSGMNNEGMTLKINSSDAGAFDYWANKVPEIKLNLDATTLIGIEGTFTFNLKAARPNNQPCNNFGIVVADGYKGVGLSFWNINDDSAGNFAFELKGQYLGIDNFQNENYNPSGPERQKNLKWLTEAVYGADGAEFKVTRKDGTITIQAKNGAEWVTISTITGVDDNVKNDIRFMGVGSNYTVSGVTLNYEERDLSTVESAEITVNAAAGFTAEGTELTFECLDKTWTGTVANGKVTIGDTNNPITIGKHNVYANFGGYQIKLGTIDIAAPASGTTATAEVNLGFAGQLQGPAPVTANPATGELTFKLGKADNSAYNDIYDIATIEGSGFFATKLKFNDIGDSQRSVTIILKVQMLDGTTKEIKYVVQNKNQYFGADGQFYMCLDDDSMGSNGVFDAKGQATQVNINAYADALKGDGLWLVLGYDAQTGGLVAYAGEQLSSVRLIKTYGNIPANLKVVGMGVGNWFGVGGNSDTATIAVKYGKTMADIGMAEAVKFGVTASLAEGCADMGSISVDATDGKYYQGAQCTVTVTVKPGYKLSTLRIGDNTIDKRSWIQNGLIYTYTFNVTENTDVLAELERATTVNVTFAFEGENVPADGTQIELKSEKDGSVTDSTVGGEAIELESGVIYDLSIYGYATVIITVPENGGEIKVTLKKAAAIADKVVDHVAITSDTIIFSNSSGSGAFDGWQTTDNPAAKLILSDEQINAQKLVLQFTLKGENAQNSFNGVFGIGMTGYKGVRLMFCTNEHAMEDGALTLADLNSLQLSENDVSGHNYNTTYGFIETLAASESGVVIRALRDGTSLKFYAQNTDGKWILFHSTTCEESAVNDICFVGNGATYTISNVSVKVADNDAARDDFFVHVSFTGIPDNVNGYKAKLDNYIVGKEGGSVNLVIETDNVDLAWGWFPNAITVDGTAIDFTKVKRESLGANRCRFTYTITLTNITKDMEVVVTVGAGTKVGYDVTANIAAAGSISCDMGDAEEYYWNDLCTLTITPKTGYIFEKLIFGDNETVISADDCTFADGKYTYAFTVTGDIKVVAHFSQITDVDVTFAVTAKDWDGTAVTLENGAQIDLTSTTVSGQTYTYTVGGEAVKMKTGTYTVTCNGFCNTTVQVEAAGEIALNLVKPIATSTSNEITVTEDKTIAIKGNGQPDRDGNRKISADLKMSEEEINSTGLTLTFTVKRTKQSTNGNDAWAASRFGVQMGEGEIGFYVFMRSAQGNAADVAKLIPGTLSLNPDQEGKSEKKWHGNDPDIKWVSDAAYGEGLQMKIVRANGVISIFAKNGEDWVALDTMGTKGETANVNDIGKLAIGNTVKNQIKFLAGGDDWQFSNIEVALPEASERATLTTSVNNSEYGTIATDIQNYYKGDKAIITVTATQGYELEKLVIGEGDNAVTITKDSQNGWTQKNNVYTYYFTVTGDIKVVAEFERSKTVESAEITVNAATGWTAEGAKLTFEHLGELWTGTVADGKVILNDAEKPVEIGSYNVYADFGGYQFKIGTTEIATPTAGTTATASVDLKFTGKLDGFEGAVSAADPSKGEVTFKLGKEADGGAYNAAYDIKQIDNGGYFATKLKFNNMGDNKWTASLIFAKPDGNEYNLVIQNAGENFGVNGEFYMNLNAGDNSIFDRGNQVNLNAYADALKGEGLWLVLAYDATTGELVTYVGTELSSVRPVKTWKNIGTDVKIARVGVGNWFGKGGNNDTVTVTLKYGATMQDIGMALEEKNIAVTASVNDATMGSIALDATDGKYYSGAECTVTVTAKAGYVLKSIKVGEAEAVTKGWTMDGNVYTYAFMVPANSTTVIATFDETFVTGVTCITDHSGNIDLDADVDGKKVIGYQTFTDRKVYSNDVFGLLNLGNACTDLGGGYAPDFKDKGWGVKTGNINGDAVCLHTNLDMTVKIVKGTTAIRLFVGGWWCGDHGGNFSLRDKEGNVYGNYTYWSNNDQNNDIIVFNVDTSSWETNEIREMVLHYDRKGNVLPFAGVQLLGDISGYNKESACTSTVTIYQADGTTLADLGATATLTMTDGDKTYTVTLNKVTEGNNAGKYTLSGNFKAGRYTLAIEGYECTSAGYDGIGTGNGSATTQLWIDSVGGGLWGITFKAVQ